MKKVLCMLLSVIMIFSSVGVMNVSAADNDITANNIVNFNSYEELMWNQSDAKVYGYTPDFIYNQSIYIDWTKLDIVYNKNGEDVRMTKNNLALVMGDMNFYLKRIIYNSYGGDKLYTKENATKITNFIGKVLNPNFVDTVVDFGNSVIPNEDEFFKKIAIESGLANIVQLNWCNDPFVEYDDLLVALGVNLIEIYEYMRGDGVLIATELLKGVFNKIFDIGIINYLINLLSTLCGGYAVTLNKPIKALLSLKFSEFSGGLTPEYIDSVAGLLNIALSNVTDYEFVTLPEYRIVTSSDVTEATFILLYYFAINYKYKENAQVIDGLASKLGKLNFAAGGYNAEERNQIKTNIGYIVDWCLKGNISTEAMTFVDGLTQDNIMQVPDDLWTRISNSLAAFFRKIVDYFEYVIKILTGELEFGTPFI